MRYKALWFGLLLIAIGVMLPASVLASPPDPSSSCSTSSPSDDDCPIMDMDGDGKPILVKVQFPDPVGEIDLPKKVYFFSGPICMVDKVIRNSIEGLYATFIGAFKNPFGAVLMLYVIFYAIGFIYGLVNPKDFAVRAFKITVVWLLVSDNCFFYKYLYETFINASNDFLMVIASTDTEPDGFSSANSPEEARQGMYKTLDELFTNVVGMKGLVSAGILLMTSLTSNSQGLTGGAMTMLGMGAMAIALVRALITLAMALAGISFFLLFTPIFLSFFMFQSTRTVFDNWLKMLISFVMQPFIIFAFLILMKNVYTATAPTAEIENLLKSTVDMVQNKELKPELATSRPVVRVFKPSKELMETAGITPDADGIGGEQFKFQEKFFTDFVSKLLIWFLSNMLMAAFIREVPALAQKLGGYISAPALGATASDTSGGFSAKEGIVLPGLTKGAGRDALQAVGGFIKGNSTLRNTATAGAATATAYAMYEAALEKQARNRNGASVENPIAVKDGANRDGMRALGIGSEKAANRDGMNAEGIGSEKTANRDGTRIEGVGEKDAAARVEMVRAQAKSAQQGTDNLNTIFNLGITAPETATANENAPAKAKSKLLNEIKLKTQTEGMAIYNVNGKSVSVAKGDEAAFLKGKIKDLENDISKSKILGGLAGEARQEALEMRSALMQRQQQLMKEARNVSVEGTGGKDVGRNNSIKDMERTGTSERTVMDAEEAQVRTLDSIREAKERAIITGNETAEMTRIEQLLPALVKRQDTENLQKEIENLEASQQARNYAEVLQDMKELKASMETGAERIDTVTMAQPMEPVVEVLPVTLPPVEPVLEVPPITPPLVEPVMEVPPPPVEVTADILPANMSMQQLADALPDQIGIAPEPVTEIPVPPAQPAAGGKTIAESLTDALESKKPEEEQPDGRQERLAELLQQQQEELRRADEKARLEQEEEINRSAAGANLSFTNASEVAGLNTLPEIEVPAPVIDLPPEPVVSVDIPSGAELLQPVAPVAEQPPEVPVVDVPPVADLPPPAAAAVVGGKTFAEQLDELAKLETKPEQSDYEKRIEDALAETQAIITAPEAVSASAPEAPVFERDAVNVSFTTDAPVEVPASTPETPAETPPVSAAAASDKTFGEQLDDVFKTGEKSEPSDYEVRVENALEQTNTMLSTVETDVTTTPEIPIFMRGAANTTYATETPVDIQPAFTSETPVAETPTVTQAPAADVRSTAESIGDMIASETTKFGEFGGATFEAPPSPDLPVYASEGPVYTETTVANVEPTAETVMTDTPAAVVTEEPVVAPTPSVEATVTEEIMPVPEATPSVQPEAAIMPEAEPIHDQIPPVAPAPAQVLEEEVQPVAATAAKSTAPKDTAAEREEESARTEAEKVAAAERTAAKKTLESATPEWMAAEAAGITPDRAIQDKPAEEQEREEAKLNVAEVIKSSDAALFSFIMKLPDGTREKVMDNMRVHFQNIRSGSPEMKKKTKELVELGRKKKGLGGAFDGPGESSLALAMKGLAYEELEKMGVNKPERQVENHRSEMAKASGPAKPGDKPA